MTISRLGVLASMAAAAALVSGTAAADPFFFSTGSTDLRIATASRPGTTGSFEIESADDFVTTAPNTFINSATFTGLFVPPINGSIGAPTDVVVEIYRVFPADSDVGRTSGPPTFSTPQVPTRVNSPSDVALLSLDSASNTLTFLTADLGSFTAANSVRPGGISLNSGGNGSVTGDEVEIGVTFTTPFDLGPGHYFFVPQVELDSGNNFLWLSAPRPIVPPGTPFPPGFTDLQSWTRDANLDPDWLRVGQDIVGGTPFPTFNETFSLTGVTVPEPGSLAVFGAALAGLGFLRRGKKAG